MDMMENDDKLITQFFQEQMPNVEDDGFSRRVMHRLPDKKRHLSRLWTIICSVVGVAFFLLIDGIDSLRISLGNVFGDFIGSVSSFHIIDFTPLAVAVGILTIFGVTLYNVVTTD
jgi:hypothetical protein